MFDLFSFISMLFTAKEIIKEKIEKPTPKGVHFDWDAYYKDIENGIGAIEQVRKRQSGGYMTTKPATPKWYELPIDSVVDTERYERDKSTYGEYIAETWRKNGRYRQIR